MSTKQQLTPEIHRQQIQSYTEIRPAYEKYAQVLGRILANACKPALPSASIQVRAKTISSFAEKVARKFDKYPDAVNQLTDLCGGRVIVQTTEQVRAVRQFIEANFEIFEKDDKGDRLSDDKFGYRDMHYIVQLKRGYDEMLGITSEERSIIGERKAEIQVRTWVQHAWADTLHDRIYKNELKISPAIIRTGNLLAALMEEGDGTFNFLAEELDGMIANYTAFAGKDKVNAEIKIQELILSNEPDKDKKPGLALKIARMIAASGDYDKVVSTLDPYKDTRGSFRCDLLLELGYALCKVHRGNPRSKDYRRGQQMLEEAVAICSCDDLSAVPDLRKRQSYRARSQSRLGWSWEVVDGEQHRARECYQSALEFEPGNPYYLAEALGCEILAGNRDLAGSMRATIRAAINKCREQALNGTELPYAYFTAGRLSLLMSEGYAAMGWYARGIQHCLDGTSVVPRDMFDSELAWLYRVTFGIRMQPPYEWCKDFLFIAKSLQSRADGAVCEEELQVSKQLDVSPPVLIYSGGAGSMTSDMITSIRPLVEASLTAFKKVGTVISGGTASGVPGCVGDIAEHLAGRDQCTFRLLGYITEKFREDALPHKAYKCYKSGADFTPGHILQSWVDILLSGVNPKNVMLIGFGGGPLSALEYRMALALGASVGVVVGTGGAVKELLEDKIWASLSNLYPLPADRMTLRAFVLPAEREFDQSVLEKMAMELHAGYVASNTKALPDKLKPWDSLNQTYKNANLGQALCAIQILEAAGFGIREAENPVVFDHNDFTREEMTLMAEMEHGRWNFERLHDGWRYGVRNDAQKIHNCLVPWSELPDDIRQYDINGICAFPSILAKAGLEIYRK